MVVGSAANSDSFKVTTPSDQEIRVTRRFRYPRQPPHVSIVLHQGVEFERMGLRGRALRVRPQKETMV